MSDFNFNEFVDMWDNDSAVEDSLKLVEAKEDSARIALDKIKTKEAYTDSINTKIKDVESEYEDMSTSEKAAEIPIVKGLKGAADLAAWTVNQNIYNVGSLAYDALGVPLNTLGRLFGYNPGLSGERFMSDYFGDYVGNVDPLISGDRDTALGTYAPEGGEFMFESKKNKEIKALQKLKESK